MPIVFVPALFCGKTINWEGSESMEITRELGGEHIGSRVRMLRMLLGVNQKRLCEALDLSVQHVNDFENGLARIDARQTERLAVELNVPLSFFAEETQKLKSIWGPRRFSA